MDMTWVSSQGRTLWRKVYNGTVFYVSCKQLREQGYNVESDTERGSYHAANL
jgi:hypothetical protein